MHDTKLANAARGLAGGLLGAWAMNVFGRAVRRIGDGREAPGATAGRDRDGRGMQPAQAVGRAEDDASTRVAAMTYRAVTGGALDRDLAPRLGNAVHYDFAAGLGLLYGLARGPVPWLGSGYGLRYGSAIWVVADQGAMPAMGLKKGPRHLGTPVLIYSLAGHWIFGATLEAVMRLSEPRPGRALRDAGGP